MAIAGGKGNSASIAEPRPGQYRRPAPALTSHSELNEAALREADIAPTTIRIAVGNEDPRSLIAHIVRASELALDAALPGFSKLFMAPEEIDRLYETIYMDVHQRYVRSRTGMAELMR